MEYAETDSRIEDESDDLPGAGSDRKTHGIGSHP